ncbi:sugar phosphate nucleotidyltransferase [Pelagibacteraceae bacterium]|nr:sugar phosphate nucleotidyltransferase [Pelagibacteraceae bacterium]
MKNFLISPNTKIKTSIKKISQSGYKTLIVEKNKLLLGTLSDGDIRRAVLHNIDLELPIKHIYNKNPYYVEVNKYTEKKVKDYILKNNIYLIPVVNKNKKIVKIIKWNQIFNKRKSDLIKKINLEVVIMAGGKGTRLQPFTNQLPKPLLPFKGKSLIENIIERFKKYGINKFHYTLNHQSKIIKYFISENYNKFSNKFYIEKTPLGTAGSLFLLKKIFRKNFFLINCDTIVDIDYNDLANYHDSNNYDMTIVAVKKNYSIPYGVIKTNKLNQIVTIDEKPTDKYIVSTGLYILNNKILNILDKPRYIDMNDFIKKSINENYKIGIYLIEDNQWTDVGSWNEYLKN